MKPLLILALLGPCAADVDRDQLLRAFAIVESGNRDLSPRWDVRQQSWGVYQFGKARWQECGGKASEWGKAIRAEQDQVMLKAIARYLKGKPVGVDAIAWAGTRHNGGKFRGETSYTRKLRAAYLTTKGKGR